MITVTEALELIKTNTSVPNPIYKKTSKCLGYVLADDIYSPINMPPFRQSAMDGYAFIYENHDNLVLNGVLKAGLQTKKVLKTNQVIRIFTGAYVPDGADTVVMQEHVTVNGNIVKIDKLPLYGANIREIGEQIKKNELVALKGTVINEALLGFLAGLGLTKLLVYKKPSVGILLTGNEIVKGGTTLKLGQIYDSNSVMLKAALQKIGIEKIKIKYVKDSLPKTVQAIKKMLRKFDYLLISGGISVGDYDYVYEALASNKVKTMFYKVNQKPGKPLLYGLKDNTSVFALPGNPASALTCFYIYAIPALRQFMGHTITYLPREQKHITHDFHNNTGKALFLKAFVENNEVSILGHQSSAMLNSFSQSNAIAYIPSHQITVQAFSVIEIIKINF